MATVDFKSAVGRIFFDGGFTDEGKAITRSKTYYNIAKDVSADDLHDGLATLASLSDYPFLRAEKIETSSVNN